MLTEVCKGHNGPVTNVKCAGQLLVSSSDDATVRVWRGDGSVVAVFALSWRVSDVVLAADGVVGVGEADDARFFRYTGPSTLMVGNPVQGLAGHSEVERKEFKHSEVVCAKGKCLAAMGGDEFVTGDANGLLHMSWRPNGRVRAHVGGVFCLASSSSSPSCCFSGTFILFSRHSSS
jgi:WD40 repeat protein